jgi:hypothetical protein
MALARQFGRRGSVSKTAMMAAPRGPLKTLLKMARDPGSAYGAETSSGQQWAQMPSPMEQLPDAAVV